MFVFMAALFLFLSAAPGFASAESNVEKVGAAIDISELNGERVGVITGTIYVEIAKEQLKDSEIYYFKSDVDAMTALKSDKVDAVLQDVVRLYYYKNKIGDVVVKAIDDDKDYLAFIAGKSEKGRMLTSKLNSLISQLDESGELDDLKRRWFEGEEKDRVMENIENLPDKNGTITIATNPAVIPFDYIKDGQLVGYEMEILYMFCEKYGYRPKIERADFDGVIAGVSTEKYDIGANGFSITEERKKSVVFTDYILISHLGAAYKEKAGGAAGSFSEKVVDGFRNTFITEDRWKSFVSGVVVTFEITVFSIIFGTVFGFLIHLICRRGNRVTNRISAIARWIVQGMPAVVMLMIAYYIIFGNSSVSGVSVAIIIFSICFACSTHNILEAGENGLDPGQLRAAVALGYGKMAAFFRILFPQIARGSLPAYLNSITTLLKGTAVVGYIAVVDITKAGDIVRGTTYEAFFPLISVAVLYFVLDGILRLAVKALTRRLNFEKRSREKILKGAKTGLE